MPIAAMSKNVALTVLKSQMTKKIVASVAGIYATKLAGDAYEKFVIERIVEVGES